MNFIENESANKLRGGYYTEPAIASFLLRWVLQNQPKTILEPSCGDGIFFRCLANLNAPSVESFVGFEIEASEALKARDAANELQFSKGEVHHRDFLSWFLSNPLVMPSYDAVVGNPPFIRYQYLKEEAQLYSEKIFNQFNLEFTKHTNAWVPFVIASIALLNSGGRIAMVLPSELLHVIHAKALRNFLASECSRILIFDPQEIWFEKTLQGAILLFAEKKTQSSVTSQGVGIIQTKTKNFLENDPGIYFERADYINGEVLNGKWMRALLTKNERETLKNAQSNPDIHKFEDIADVVVGIVTGANKFFLVPDKVVDEFELQSWAYPMFGRSEHVPGVIYDESTLIRNRELGLPTNFIWFRDEKFEQLPEKVQIYIRTGEKLDLQKRYKCRIREPWYCVPSVYAAPVGMLKRCYDYHKLILNKYKAFSTDTSYRIYPKIVNEASLVFSYINSLTALTAELEGRHYGGGVLELVPSEIRRLSVPIKIVEEKDVSTLDELVAKNIDPIQLFEIQDRLILNNIGVLKSESDTIREAWLRLKMRRQRKEIVD